MRKWVCTICGFVHYGETPPEVCPQCKAPSSKFGDRTNMAAGWADEHRVGIAQGCDATVVDGLRAHYLGECSEVATHLAMARQAEREGYPEVAAALRQVAQEEAAHAARLAELLGEGVEASTKNNLQKRVEGERFACENKKQLAVRAKELNLDSIHDAIHEMCKDEARHGAIFTGLLARYFK